MNSYKITLLFYGARLPEKKYIKAKNYAEAQELGRKFITPAMGCQFVEVDRIRKADVPQYDEPGVDYAHEALIHAEYIGVCEYRVNGTMMEYWSLYDEGFWFITYDLFMGEETRDLRIPWRKGAKIPDEFTGPHGGTLYNYFEG